jgi:tRNA U34 5-methylaminomethyl-2-thiouridine-forming methyltransferase MnmC
MLFVTGDGSHSIEADRYGVPYHSRYGAITESAHVFIAAGLRYKAVVQREIAILEMGFGTGLNAFMTLLEAEKRNLAVQYTGLEIYPLPIAVAATLNYPLLLEAEHRAEVFLSMHQCTWETPHIFSDHFIFQKKAVPIEEFQASDAFDIIYFDAFAPQSQPELWSEEVFAHAFNSLRSGGVLVTYCAQGHFRRTLRKAGFQVESLQGPPGKREMTRAIRS